MSPKLSSCYGKIPCVFPSGKSKNQIPCFPYAVATMLHERLLSFLKEFFHPGPKQLLLPFEHHSLTCYVQNRLQLQWVKNSGTARKFAKVMFLHLYVSHSVHGGASRGSAFKGGLHRGGVCIQGGLHLWGVGRPPQSDTTGYGQRAGGTHPTGMHFCVLNEFGEYRKKST